MLLFRGLIIIAIIINLIIIKNLTVTIIIATIIKSILCKLSHSNKFYSLNSNFSPSYINLPNSYITENLLWFENGYTFSSISSLLHSLSQLSFSSKQLPLKEFLGGIPGFLGNERRKKGIPVLALFSWMMEKSFVVLEK